MYLIDNSKNKTNNFAGDIYGKIRTKPFLYSMLSYVTLHLQNRPSIQWSIIEMGGS